MLKIYLVKQTLTEMAIGMSIALYTTLTGLIFSQFTKVQLVSPRVVTNEIVERTCEI